MSSLNNSVTQPGVQEIGNLVLSVTGGAVFYVGTSALTAAFADVAQGIAGRTFTSVNAALANCVSGRGDIIYCLPGYTENITTGTPWPNLTQNDVRIIGLGHNTNRPTFTWTATGSQIPITTANFMLQNCVLNLAGTASTSTTKAIAITGAGSIIDNCYIIAGAAGGSQTATIGIEYGSGADKATFTNNEMNSPTDSANVSPLKIVAAIDRFRMYNNIIDVGVSTTGGSVINMTTAPTNVWIANNIMRNGIASSTKAFVGVSGATGYMENNRLYITAATGGATAGGTFGSLQLNLNVGAAGGNVTAIAVGSNSS